MNDYREKVIEALLDAQTLTATTNGSPVSTTNLEGNRRDRPRRNTRQHHGDTQHAASNKYERSKSWAISGCPGEFTTAGGTAIQNVNPGSCLGFMRCVASVGGTSPSFPIAVLYIGMPRYP